MSRIELCTFRIGLLLILAFASSQAFARYPGSMRGGALHGKDSHNPWFIQNTEVIPYCIDYYRDQVSAPLALVKEKIEEAFKYWKKQFDHVKASNSLIKVGTQKLAFGDCDETTLLRFQIGGLTAEQREEFPDVSDYIGAAVRESYDKELLQGKGYIYIAPDKGKQALTVKDGVSLPWSYRKGALLLRVLIHEFGHVFGLSDDNGWLAHNNILNADYPEFILNKKYADVIASLDLPEIFSWANGGVFFQSCGSAAESVSVVFFHNLNGMKCLKAEIETILKGYLEVRVSAAPDRDGVWRPIGRAKLFEVARTREAKVSVWLSEKQKVIFDRFDKPITGRKLAAAVYHIDFVGTYKIAGGSVERPVMATISPDETRQRFGGVRDGELILDLKRSL